MYGTYLIICVSWFFNFWNPSCMESFYISGLKASFWLHLSLYILLHLCCLYICKIPLFHPHHHLVRSATTKFMNVQVGSQHVSPWLRSTCGASNLVHAMHTKLCTCGLGKLQGIYSSHFHRGMPWASGAPVVSNQDLLSPCKTWRAWEAQRMRINGSSKVSQVMSAQLRWCYLCLTQCFPVILEIIIL